MERMRYNTNKLIADRWIVWLIIFIIVVSPLEHVIRIEHILYPIVVALLVMRWIAQNTMTMNLSVPLLLFIIYYFVSGLWSPVLGAVGSAIRGGIVYIMLYLLLQFRYQDDDYEKFKVAIIIQGCVMIILVTVFGTYKDLRLWISVGENGVDPNYLSAWMIMPITVAVEYIFIKNTKFITKIFLVVEVVLSLFIISLSASRSGLITNVLAVVLCVACFFWKTIKKHPVTSIGFVLIVALALIYGYHHLPETMTSRLLAANGGMGGRRYIWDQLINVLSNNWLACFFGFGHGTVTYLNAGHSVSHNTFLDILVQYGVVGLFLYLYFIYKVLKKSFKKDVYITIGLVSLFVLLCTLSGMTIRILIITLFMCGCTIFDISSKELPVKSKV